MKNKFYRSRILPAVLAFLLTAAKLCGQQFDCSATYPVFKMDFGDDQRPVEMQLAYVRKFYSAISGPCPDDGEYTFTSAVNNCFNGNWYNIPKDHTPGSNRGRMMLVNAARQPSAFFTYLVTGLKDNAHYIFSTWFLNVCRPDAECTSTLPQIHALITDKGKILASARSGDIDKSGPGGWRQITAEFTLPAGTTSCLIFMETEADGGCGNDFAMDDIEVKMCKIIEAPVKSVPAKKPAVIPPAKTVQPKPAPKTAAVKPAPVLPTLKKSEGVVKKEPLEKTVQRPAIANPVAGRSLPPVLQTRPSIIAKQIETPADELEINLYDNGEIDGDTVSIYHNNAPLLLHAGLSARPLSFKITVNEQTPHHELVMVADNLGSIPPNTSVMIVTSKTNRWQISLSSSEKQNAKVVIDLKRE